MKVAPSDQLDLLELQQTDLSISRLAHAIETHPLREKLSEMDGRAQDLRRSVVAQEADIADRERRIADLDKQIAEVVARRDLQTRRLNSGEVPMRDMNAVEHEIAQIIARKDDLDYELLEAVEAVEERKQFVAETKRAQEALEVDEVATKAELAEALVQPNEELAALEEKRAALRDSLPEDVLDEYDYYRTRMGALVVLAYENGFLKDAPIELSGAEESALASAPEDVLWQSEETQHFVVRL